MGLSDDGVRSPGFLWPAWAGHVRGLLLPLRRLGVRSEGKIFGRQSAADFCFCFEFSGLHVCVCPPPRSRLVGVPERLSLSVDVLGRRARRASFVLLGPGELSRKWRWLAPSAPSSKKKGHRLGRGVEKFLLLLKRAGALPDGGGGRILLALCSPWRDGCIRWPRLLSVKVG